MNRHDEGVSDTERHEQREKERDGRSASEWRAATQRYYDPDGETELTTEIIAAVAAARGVDLHEVKFPRLYECIDAPALEQAFFGDGDQQFRGQDGSFEFRYAEYLVTVRSDGWITVFTAAERAS